MKLSLRSAIFSIGLILGIGTIVFQLISSPAAAAGTIGVEKYKVLIVDRMTTGQIEELLNGLAAEGWKVRTGFDLVIVMAK